MDVRANTPELLAGWIAHSSRTFGMDISYHVPNTWVCHIDALVGQLTWALNNPNPNEAGLPPMSIQRQEAEGKSLQDFTDFTIEQHKQMIAGSSDGGALKIADTTLGGLAAAKTMYSIPIEELGGSKAVNFQTWAKAGNFIFMVTFLCLEENFDDAFKRQCNVILKSFKFGDLRQEHVLLKTTQLRSGFRLSTPATWSLIEEGSGLGSIFKYLDTNGTVQASVDFDVKFGKVDVNQEAVRAYLALKVPSAENSKFNLQSNLGSIPAVRVDFKIPDQDMAHGILFVAYHDSEWFHGGAYLLLQCQKPKDSNAPLDLLERTAATIGLPVDPLDEDDLQIDTLFTYENLNFGFGFKFNKNKHKPKALCAGVKLLPTTASGMCPWPYPEISGTFAPVVVAGEKGLDLGVMAQQISELILKSGPNIQLSSSTSTKVGGLNALKLVYRAHDHQVQLTNFISKTENFLIILRWIVFIHEANASQPFIDEVVNSFYYFGPQ